MPSAWLAFPVYLPIGPLNLHPHFFFETLAYTVSALVYARLRNRLGDPILPDARWWVIAAAAAGAALGAKLLFWLEDPALTLQHWSDPAYLLAGKTIVGGLIGGLVAVEWTKLRIGVKQSTGDLFAVPLALGIAVGRIGCFLTGLADHTYGTATILPWGVDFGDGVPRHPTQLYEILFLLPLAFFLLRFVQRPHRNGDAFKTFMVAYLGFRLLVDFLKPGMTLAGLSSIQWACVGVLIYYSNDIKRWVGARPANGLGATFEPSQLQLQPKLEEPAQDS